MAKEFNKESFRHRPWFLIVNTSVSSKLLLAEISFVGWRVEAYHRLHLRARCLWRLRVNLYELFWMMALLNHFRLDSINYLAGILLRPVVLLQPTRRQE